MALYRLTYRQPWIYDEEGNGFFSIQYSCTEVDFESEKDDIAKAHSKMLIKKKVLDFLGEKHHSWIETLIEVGEGKSMRIVPV